MSGRLPIPAVPSGGREWQILTDAVEKIGKERAERLAGTFEGLFSAALAVPSANRVCSIYPQAV